MARRIIKHRKVLAGADVTGDDAVVGQLLSNFDAFKADVGRLTKRGVERVAMEILRESNLRAPFETGALQESGSVRVSKQSGGTYIASVTYGGVENPVEPTKNAPKGVVTYAVLIHENLQKHPLVTGEPKFLQNGAAVVARSGVQNIIALLKGAA